MPNKTRDYGDLRVTMTSDWQWRWNDAGTGATRAIDVYHAKSQGEAAANTTAHSGDLQPQLATSLGDICTSSYSNPSVNEVWCVREDLAIDSEYEPASLWDDRKSGADLYASVWAIARPVPERSGTEKICVLNDTCRLATKDRYDMPDWRLAKVLGLLCPRDFQAFTSKTPEFTKDNLPSGGDRFGEQEQAAVILSYTAFFPSSDPKSLNLISDPFISLSRYIAWEVNTTHTNNSAGEISDKTTVTKGVSQTDTAEMSHSAGVDSSTSYGLGSFGGSISLNYQFTATNSTSFNEYRETVREQGFTVKAFQASVYLVRHVWLKARRSNGSVTLAQIGYNMNEDMILVGVDLK